MFYLNSHSNFYYGHIDKKDTFAEFGKSAHNERFVFMWDNSPPFARNPHTLNLCISRKCINYDKTAASYFLAVFKKCCQDLDDTF